MNNKQITYLRVLLQIFALSRILILTEYNQSLLPYKNREKIDIKIQLLQRIIGI